MNKSDIKSIAPAEAVHLIVQNQGLTPDEQLGYLKSFHARLSHSNKTFSNWVDRLKDCGGQTSHDWLAFSTAGLPNSASVLDAGCGTGELLSRLAAENPSRSFVGVDVSEEQISVAQTDVKNPNLQFVVAEMSNIPVETSSVDAVISHYTLMLFVPLAMAITEFSRITKSHGKLLAAVPCYWLKPSIRLPTFEKVMSSKMKSIMPTYPNIGLMNSDCESEDGIKQALDSAGYSSTISVREYSTRCTPDDVLGFMHLLYPYDLCPADQRDQLDIEILAALKADAAADGTVVLARCVASIDATKFN